MARIAGDDPGYTYRLCSTRAGIAKATKMGFTQVSASTFIGEVMGKPAGAMSWWGYRIGLTAVVDALSEDPVGVIDLKDAEALEAYLKERGTSPNVSRDAAGSRGDNAHDVLEQLAGGNRQHAEYLANQEEMETGARYGSAVISWWDQQIVPSLHENGILQVRSEVPIFSMRHWYSGTFDLALLWRNLGWEILDLKTHKPARGFTKKGKGPAYLGDITQVRAYRMAFEEMAELQAAHHLHGYDFEFGPTFRNRIVVARENGKYLEDDREVSRAFVVLLRDAYDHVVEFEREVVA